MLEEQDICRTLADELLRDETRMAEREDRLRHEERELTGRRDEFCQREPEFSAQQKFASTLEATLPEPAVAISAALTQRAVADWTIPIHAPAESEALSQSSRPVQTLLTLVVC